MKNVLISILKNAILLIVVVVSIVSFLNGYLNWRELLAMQLGLGFIYVFLSCYEYLNASYKANLPVTRYAYFPYSFFMYKILKASFFASFALMLLTSGTRVKYLYPICFIIAATELIVMVLRYQKRLCFVSVYANYLLFSKHILFKIFASEIKSIEFRHGIFYIIKKDNRSEDIRVVNIENKEEFTNSMVNWIEKNAVTMSNESQESLKKFISKTV